MSHVKACTGRSFHFRVAMGSGMGEDQEGYKVGTNVLGLVIGAIMLGYGISYQVFQNNVEINIVKKNLFHVNMFLLMITNDIQL